MTLPMQPVPDDGVYDAEDVSDHGRNHDEHNRRRWIKRLDEVHGLIMCAQKMKSRIGCAQPIRTRTDQTTCQPAINAAITSPTFWGLAIISQCHSERSEESRIKS